MELCSYPIHLSRKYKRMTDAPIPINQDQHPTQDFPSYLTKDVPYHPHVGIVFLGGHSMFRLI
jgi:hypothetical protein